LIEGLCWTLHPEKPRREASEFCEVSVFCCTIAEELRRDLLYRLHLPLLHTTVLHSLSKDQRMQERR
jgi:hypothetical protein